MSNYRALPVHLLERVARFKMYVLRDRSGVALNVSCTPDGLKWTCNKKGKALYYKNAFVVGGKIVGKDLRPSNKVVVERFVPVNYDPFRRDREGNALMNPETGRELMDSVNVFKQSAESTWVEKAVRLHYMQ